MAEFKIPKDDSYDYLVGLHIDYTVAGHTFDAVILDIEYEWHRLRHRGLVRIVGPENLVKETLSKGALPLETKRKMWLYMDEILSNLKGDHIMYKWIDWAEKRSWR